MQRTLRLSAAPRELVLVAALAATALPTMYGTHPGEGIRHWIAATIAAVAGLSLVVAASRAVRLDLMAAALAACSAAAATVHFAVISEHVEDYWLFGVFFGSAGLAQALFAVLVVQRPSRLVYAAGAAGNAAIVALWIVTRTAGLPMGPDPGEAEAVGTADVVSTVLELLIVIGCVSLLLRPLRVRVHRPLLAAILLAAGLVTTIALVSITGAHAHGDHENPGDHAHHHG
jgi:hypothetical protein